MLLLLPEVEKQVIVICNGKRWKSAGCPISGAFICIFFHIIWIFRDVWRPPARHRILGLKLGVLMGKHYNSLVSFTAVLILSWFAISLFWKLRAQIDHCCKKKERMAASSLYQELWLWSMTESGQTGDKTVWSSAGRALQAHVARRISSFQADLIQLTCQPGCMVLNIIKCYFYNVAKS